MFELKAIDVASAHRELRIDVKLDASLPAASNLQVASLDCNVVKVAADLAGREMYARVSIGAWYWDYEGRPWVNYTLYEVLSP